MFIKYFNLREQPFGSTPDPRFLFHSDSHREALASLYCAFYANRGFTTLIAEPGMGKTTVLFEFIERIRDCARTIFLFNTFCGPDDIVSYILGDCGIEPGPSVADRYRQINNLLIAEAKAGRPVVLVVDEAQNLLPHTLEGIRLLSNFETSRSKLIQVVLTGQPQLASLLARPELSQLRQRISTFCQIERFSAAETHMYIEHRLKFAGYEGEPLFAAGALDLIAEKSTGIPRVINTLCFNALCLCRARQSMQVSREMVAEAITDLELPGAESETVAAGFYVPPAAEPAAAPTPRRRSRRIVLLPAVALASFVVAVALTGIYESNLSFGQLSAALRSQIGALIGHSTRRTPQAVPRVDPSAKPAPGATDASPSSRIQGVIETKKPPQAIKVTVNAGDTLAALATDRMGKFDGVALRQIQELNPQLTNPDHIEAGVVIQLPSRNLSSTVSARSQR